MSRMIPPYISRDVKSRGEKLLFKLFKDAPGTDDWVVVHALGVAKHKTRVYGEIDFMVLAPGLGVFCLEVKSGRVKREQGVWKFTNRYGDTAEKTRGPFEQAQEAMFSIKSAVRRQYGGHSPLNKLLFGYGVMFPDIKFNTHGPDQEGWLVYDRDSRKGSVSDYIRRLAAKTREKVKDARWFDPAGSLPTKEVIAELAYFLRGDFERRITPRQILDDIEEQLGEYTTEQYVVLDQLAGNPRCLFRGAAGTGKTMLALESARRSMLFGLRTLLLCHSELLGEWLREQLPVAARGKLGFAGDWGRFLARTRKSAIKPFDVLIVDEGQELISPASLDIIEPLLKGGLRQGEWQIFCDFEKHDAEKIRFTLEARGGTFAHFKLTTNCRNGGAIGKLAAQVAGLTEAPALPGMTLGRPVGRHYYSDGKEQLRMLKELLKSLKHGRIAFERITILSSKPFKDSCAAGLNRKAYHLADVNTNPSQLGGKKQITFSTIQKYKGLENSYVVITDVEDVTSEEARSLLYLGVTRAQAGLDLLVSESSRQDFEKLLQDPAKGSGGKKRRLWE